MYIGVTIKRYRAVKEVGQIKMSVRVIAYYQLIQACQVNSLPIFLLQITSWHLWLFFCILFPSTLLDHYAMLLKPLWYMEGSFYGYVPLHTQSWAFMFIHFKPNFSKNGSAFGGRDGPSPPPRGGGGVGCTSGIVCLICWILHVNDFSFLMCRVISFNVSTKFLTYHCVMMSGCWCKQLMKGSNRK